MELPDLKVFIEVVEKGGITRAATALNRVPSNVTARIKNSNKSWENHFL